MFCLINTKVCVYSHRIASEVGTSKKNYFHQHFLSENHHGLLEDCEIRLIDKTDPSDPTRREFLSMRKLKTLAPLDLNILEGDLSQLPLVISPSLVDLWRFFRLKTIVLYAVSYGKFYSLFYSINFHLIYRKGILQSFNIVT